MAWALGLENIVVESGDLVRCMYCGNCYTMCPAMPLADGEGDGISIWVGGKVSNARSAPMFSKLAIPYLPNNPPRWPETVEAVKKIVETELREKLTTYIGVAKDCLVVGNGSDELIDRIMRLFVEKGESVLSFSPTFAIPRLCVNRQGGEYVAVPLLSNLQLDVERMLAEFSDRTRLLYICSPNSPTSTQFKLEDVETLAEAFPGVVGRLAGDLLFGRRDLTAADEDILADPLLEPQLLGGLFELLVLQERLTSSARIWSFVRQSCARS
jgi:ferredoxin